MADATPLPCTPSNCGELFAKCGLRATYVKKKCRCIACREANNAYNRRRYADNAAAESDRKRRYREADPERVRKREREAVARYRAAHRNELLESRRQWYAENREDAVERSARYRDANREKVREYGRRKYAENPEAAREQSRRYRAENREVVLEARRQWHADNRDAIKENKRRWREANPEQGRVDRHRRKARLRDAFVEDVDPKLVFEADGYICQLCGIDCPRDAVWPAPNFASLDHIKPLSRGGLHCYTNVQTLCLRCNISKGAKE